MRNSYSTAVIATLLLFLGLSVGAANSQQKETFTPYHVSKIQTVLSAKISPDGKHIAYILNVPRKLGKEKDGAAWTELHIVTVGGMSRPFITGSVNVAGIGWTPDGKSVSFLAKRDGDKNRSLYVIPVAGGEARKVMEHETSIQDYSWSPDGKRVAFLATAPRKAKDKKLNDLGFSQEIYEESVPSVHVWVGSTGAGNARKLNIKGSVWNVVWSPVGNNLAVAASPLPLIDHRYMFRKVRIVDANTGKIVRRLDIPGKMGQIAWSTNGKYVALVAGVDKHDPREGRLWVASIDGSKWYDALPGFMGHVDSIAWQDGETIIYQASVGCQTSVGAVNVRFAKNTLAGKDTTVRIGANAGPVLRGISVASKSGTAAFIGDSPTFPGEVFIAEPKSTKPRRLTWHNPWFKNMRFATQEVITHKSRDGLSLEGVLIRPLDEKKGTRYPLVLTVHGGPEAHVPNGWVTRYAYLGQVGAANGFAIFYPNYRGSTGRGVKFSTLGQADAAGKEFDDLVDAVDHLVAMGLVNKKKVGITGGSYGGYATAWGSTYYSDRFAAGVMFVGISDGISKTGTTDIPWEMNLVHHRKWLWEDWNYFVKSSPIFHIKKAKTPLLILHGKNDPRVHPGQSMELYRHLKVYGKGKIPVRLVFYPGEGHGNRRTASRLDYNLRLLRWMSHYLQGSGGAAPPRRVEYDLKKLDG